MGIEQNIVLVAVNKQEIFIRVEKIKIELQCLQ